MSPSPMAFVGQTLAKIASFQCYSTATIVLFYYEYLITLDREVELVWRKRFSFVSVLFLVLRYTTLIVYVPTLYFETSPPSDSKACVNFAHLPGAMNSISLGLITIILILRTYALYFRNTWILFMTIPLGLTNVVLAIWASTNLRATLLTFGTGELHACIPDFLVSTAPYVSSWGTTIAFDTLISYLTISKTFRMHRTNVRVGVKSRLTTMMLHDGSFYYVVMTCVNIINFVLFWVKNINDIQAGAGNSSEIAHALSVIIVSRMILNILEAGDNPDLEGMPTKPSLTSFDANSHGQISTESGYSDDILTRV